MENRHTHARQWPLRQLPLLIGITLSCQTYAYLDASASQNQASALTPIQWTVNQYALSPIDQRQPNYLSSDLGSTVDAVFAGGTLQMDDANGQYNQNFTLSNQISNTIDQDGHISVFDGDFFDAVGTSGGQITINNSGSNSGIVIFNGNNTYTGQTTLKNGVLSISRDNNLGHQSAKINFDGGTLLTTSDIISNRQVTLTSSGQVDVSRATEFALTGVISGTGPFTKIGKGTLTLSGANTYSGNTQLEQGTIKANTANTLSANSAITTAANTLLDLNNHQQVIAGLTHAGTLQLSHGSKIGTTLTINGDYQGHNGTIYFNANLATFDIDNVVINGATNGHTYVKVTNVSPSGNATTGDGIETITINSSTPTQNNATFSLTDIVTGGIYEYNLVKAQNGSWYLQSHTQNNKTTISPAGGNFLANQYAANHLFDLTFDDRNFAYAPDSHLWLRSYFQYTSLDLAHQTQDVDVKSQALQLGSDLFQYQQFTFGAFAGYGGSSTRSRSYVTDHHIDGHINGYHVGLYGAWQGDNKDYIDIWGYYSWFDNQLNGQKYDSHAWTASIEYGYPIELFQHDQNTWFIKPHAQAYYTKSKTDSFTDKYQTLFDQAKNNGFRSRLGARFYAKSQTQLGLQPYLEANWLYDDIDNSVKLNHTRLSATQTRHLGELKVGLDGFVTPSLSSQFQMSGRKGKHTNYQYEAQLGIRYYWK